MRIFALDSAVSRCSATIVADGTVIAGQQQDLDRGHATVLAVMAQGCLRDAGLTAADLDLVAVTVGPGSFTGIRGGIALAQGIGLAAGCPVIGVTVGESLAESLSLPGDRAL
ncbi:MAG: tRNA (adenosine(37)-N6)-threonylcarbamoyltransferase complex dimerization subunit type 1 TsaB, partial [Rhodopila sp.]